MTQNNGTTQNEPGRDEETTAPEKVAIEGNLPLTAIDIESQKAMMSGRYHDLRGFFKWFAARPTPAVRLAILASVHPGEIGSDELLKLMQIGPKEINNNISEYVERKFNKERTGSGTVDDHYGYTNPTTKSPTKSQIKDLHEKLRDGWGGELPTILDPTCGRGIIPFESIRYGLPTVANELNPVPTLISKVALEYVPEVGSLTPEIYEWRDKIHETAKENLRDYYPTQEEGREILNSAATYIIECESCGGEIPTVMKWWLNKTSNGGDAIKPIYDDGEVQYKYVKVQDADDGYDPNDGPVNRGDAECPHCGVITDSDSIREYIREGNFEYSIYGVNYENKDGSWEFRAGSEVDKKGMQKAAKRVESDFEMMDFLSEPIEGGLNQDQIKRMGMEQWRDIFTPRQLVGHYEYLQAFNEYKYDIVDKYDEQKAEAILTLLALSSARTVGFSSRLTAWLDARGYPNKMFMDNNYSLKKMFGDNNISQSRLGYKRRSDHIVDSYEELNSYNPIESADIFSQDAATLSNDLQSTVDVAVVDPPYYDSIMYAELADVFYVVQKQYLRDIFPNIFDSKLTNKEEEAVANPSRFKNLADNESREQMAENYYKNKMGDIFADLYNILSDGGVMTVMFTHREMDAWDTLTSALIEAGFIITATHPIKTEMADRIGTRGDDSADSSIFLTARKRSEDSEQQNSLWSDVEDDIYTTAKQAAEKIIDSEYHISKTDTAIAAYGPTLEEFVRAHPVVNKNGEDIRPRKALSKARQAVTSVLVEEYLDVNGVDTIDPLTRWYVLVWLIHENDTLLYDEARQIGIAADVDIDDIKRDTKIWGKSGGDLQLKQADGRVQDIVRLENEDAEDPSTRKYPVDPTSKSFPYVIDAVHSAVHVYDREGSDRALQWLKERNMDTNTEFHVAIIALLETMPTDTDMADTLQKLVQGQTGEYLNIDLTTFSSTADSQTDISEWMNNADE